MNYILAIPAVAWLLLSALFFAGGEYLSKRWGMAPSFGLASAVIGIDALATLLWLPAMLHGNHLSIMGTTWLVLALIANIAIGTLVFHEHLTAAHWSGIALAAVAVVLLGT